MTVAWQFYNAMFCADCCYTVRKSNALKLLCVEHGQQCLKNE